MREGRRCVDGPRKGNPDQNVPNYEIFSKWFGKSKRQLGPLEIQDEDGRKEVAEVLNKLCHVMKLHYHNGISREDVLRLHLGLLDFIGEALLGGDYEGGEEVF